MKSKIILSLVIVAALIFGISVLSAQKKAALVGSATTVQPPVMSVAAVTSKTLQGMVTLTGTLVPREEVLVGAEADGLRVTAIYADEGDTVKAGQVLADLARDVVDAQVAQNKASLQQAQSQIASAQASVDETSSALERVRILKSEGFATQAALDQREAAAKTAVAQLNAARSAYDVVRAQGRELSSALGRRFLKAPVDGVVARRTASLGQVVSGAGEPLFRIIQNGEIELLADVPEKDLALLAVGQKASVRTDGGVVAEGAVRLVSPEVNPDTRMGRVRVFVGVNTELKIGAFARAAIVSATVKGLAVPSRAIAFTPQGPTVMVVVDNKVKTQPIVTGISDMNDTQVLKGLNEGALVVEKAGTFLRDGDVIEPARVP